MAARPKPEELTAEEQSLLDRWLWFYEQLASGEQEPKTDAQRRFFAVSRGHAVAKSPHEVAYIKWRRLCAASEA